MTGAGWVLAVVLLVYSISILLHHFIAGRWVVLQLPLTWFYGSWIAGLALLALPIFKYSDVFSSDSAAYFIAIVAAFSFGSVSAAFWNERRTGVPGVSQLGRRISPKVDVSRKLLLTLLVLGIIGTSLVFMNAVLGGSLTISERLDTENFAALRAEARSATASRIGPLFGPANLMSAIGSLGVAYAFYLLGSRANTEAASRGLLRLAVLMLMVNVFTGFVGFGSRMFSVIGLLVAFIAFVQGRWTIGERVIAKRFSVKSFLLISISTALTIMALWLAATVFLERRVQSQDPQLLMYRTHRASLSPLVYNLSRNDRPSQYFLLSLSYLSTPIPTMVFYFDLPAARQPGPFYGEYNFPAIWRWGRRLTFTGDPYGWDRARYGVFKPLGDIGFGMNVWSTLIRDLIADFGKSGSLLAVAILGYFAQRTFDLQRAIPSVRRAGLLVYLRLILMFSGLISLLFMPQIYWPFYGAILLLIFSRGGGDTGRHPLLKSAKSSQASAIA